MSSQGNATLQTDPEANAFIAEMQANSAQMDQNALVISGLVILIAALTAWLIGGWLHKRISHRSIVIVLSLFFLLTIFFFLSGFATGSLIGVLNQISDFGSRASKLFLLIFLASLFASWLRLFLLKRKSDTAGRASVETFE